MTDHPHLLQESVFEVISVWINIKSLGNLTNLSQSPHLRGHVKHIVFSALRFRTVSNEAEYLATVKDMLTRQTDDPSIVSLRFGQHKLAYEASIKAQQYLQHGGLDLQVLTNALRTFVNIETVTFDHPNTKIGFNQLADDFGWFSAYEMLVYDEVHVLRMLVQALSQAKTRLKDLRIGARYGFFGPREYDAPELGVYAMERRLDSDALVAAFSHPDMLTHAQQVMSQVRAFTIGELGVGDNRHDLLGLATMIKRLTSYSPKLQSLDIEQPCNLNPLSNTQPLSIENLFDLQSAYHLQEVILTHLKVTYHQNIISFLPTMPAL